MKSRAAGSTQESWASSLASAFSAATRLSAVASEAVEVDTHGRPPRQSLSRRSIELWEQGGAPRVRGSDIAHGEVRRLLLEWQGVACSTQSIHASCGFLSVLRLPGARNIERGANQDMPGPAIDGSLGSR